MAKAEALITLSWRDFLELQDKPPTGGGLMLSMVAASVDKCYHGRLTKIS